MAKDITVIIPALNEEKNIEVAIDSAIAAINGCVDDYEIIVINDGSRDRTGPLAEAKAQSNPKIKVYHNDGNKGYGYTFTRGIKSATKSYISAYPGDNDISGSSFRDLMEEIGKEDLVITYMADMKNRTFLRRLLSRSFVALMNGLFGLKLRYYNGLFIFKRSIVQSMPVKSNSFAIIAEYIVRMIKSGCSYREICFVHTGRKAGKSTALRPRNVIKVIKTIGILVKDFHFTSDYQKK